MISPTGTVVKNPPASAGDARDMGEIPGSGRPPEYKMATHSSILAWKMPWTEVSGGLQSLGLQRVGHNLATKHSTAHDQVLFLGCVALLL